MDKPTFTATFLPGPILQSPVDHLPFAALRSLQLTCRQYTDLYRWALPTKWNIDNHLGRFVRDPKAFRAELDECNGIVSGSVALAFFDQSTDNEWRPSDMDVYVPSSQSENCFNT
jgi:hypothetical protein